MELNKKNNYPEPDNLSTPNVASSTECTGLVQVLPDDDNSMEAYSEIYDIPKQGNLCDLKDGSAKSNK